MKKISFKYDKAAGALYLRVGGGRVVKTLENSSGFFIDYDKNDRIIGIEILDVTSTSNPNKILLNIKNLQKISTR